MARNNQIADRGLDQARDKGIDRSQRLSDAAAIGCPGW